MQELKIGSNEENQRVDRFVGKYLDLAPKGFINKMIRKKNIEVNKKRTDSNYILKSGDMVQLFLSDETIDKFKSKLVEIESGIDVEVIYEDENILLVNKPVGLLSHSAGDDEDEDLVKAVLNYLRISGSYNPKEELTFTPSICNRLDKNTSGIIIVGKTYDALKQSNRALSGRKIRRMYKSIVYGSIEEDIHLVDNAIKNDEDNKVYLTNSNEGTEMETYIRVLKRNKKYSLIEVELITGRTHQIRLHLNSIKHPIIGERKYNSNLGNIDKNMENKYNIRYQLLNGYKVVLGGYEGDLAYLNGKEFISNKNEQLNKIENEVFK